MARFTHKDSLKYFQRFTGEVYSLPDDRMFSLDALLMHQQRFSMRALKGIRKKDAEKLRSNLLIALSWLVSVANRLHIEIEDVVWKRFPYCCSYCGNVPCECKIIKPEARKSPLIPSSNRPESLGEFQEMFEKIYPSRSRTLEHAGVHLAEEMGEVSEAVHQYMGSHLEKDFENTENEIADYVSCFFGVANSANIDVAREMETMFYDNCHVCHALPCQCSYGFIIHYAS